MINYKVKALYLTGWGTSKVAFSWCKMERELHFRSLFGPLKCGSDG